MCSGSWYLTFGISVVLHSDRNVLYPRATQGMWNVNELFSFLFYSILVFNYPSSLHIPKPNEIQLNIVQVL